MSDWVEEGPARGVNVQVRIHHVTGHYDGRLVEQHSSVYSMVYRLHHSMANSCTHKDSNQPPISQSPSRLSYLYTFKWLACIASQTAKKFPSTSYNSNAISPCPVNSDI